MIKGGSGNILIARVEALVCPVNCVGVMGAGLALQFRHAFPVTYKLYARDCAEGRVRLGKIEVFIRGKEPCFILLFPTKRHWRDKSRIADIEAGLKDLTRLVEFHGIKSIAIPALGCGLGGLRWGDVRPLIEHAFAPLPGVEVLLFPPRGAEGRCARYRRIAHANELEPNQHRTGR